jgi:hypothetical protein
MTRDFKGGEQEGMTRDDAIEEAKRRDGRCPTAPEQLMPGTLVTSRITLAMIEDVTSRITLAMIEDGVRKVIRDPIDAERKVGHMYGHAFKKREELYDAIGGRVPLR